MLELRNIRYSRPGGWRLDVDSLRLAPRRLIRVTGANGAGKTTLLRLLAYHLRPHAGSIVYRGADVGSDRKARRVLRHEVVLVHQSPFLFDRTVLDNVLYGLRLRRVPRSEARRRAADALDRLGVAALSKRPARELSGGEGQRVALARALVLRPRVLLLDEPTAAVDAENAARVRDLIATRDWSPDASVVVTTHTGSRIGIAPDESFSIRGGRLHQFVERPPGDTAAERTTAGKKAEET